MPSHVAWEARRLTRTGTVFDIQRCSVHDGPGIRTTVFLKGCGLRCFWCHNPEGMRATAEVRFYPERCIGCGACLAVCPTGAHRLQHGNHDFERHFCQACGRCAQACYAGALELSGSTMRVEQVLAEVLQDLAFYRNSGGGVTLSGGEPLSQSAFARALLECCQAEGIHTAIETAANCPWHTLLEILPFTDLVMMDLKLMDASKHRALTGVSNAQILANARRLMQTDKPVIFRVPIVPTVNDTAAEISTVASFVRSLAELRLESSHMGANAPLPTVELLPFHPLAADKYRSLGWDYRASRLKPPTVEKMEQLRHTVTSQGVKCRE